MTKEERVEKFNEIYSQNAQKVYGLVKSLIIDQEEVYDVCQDIWVKVYSKLDTFRNQSRVSTWIYRIAYNESIDHLRKNKKYAENISLETEYEDRIFSAEENSIHPEKLETVFMEAIKTLPTLQRAVFYLRYFEELPYKEIAGLLDKNESTVKSSYFFAVQKIKDYITQKFK